LLPDTVTVRPATLLTELFGEIELIDGTGIGSTVKGRVFEAPPPGAGFTIVTDTAPGTCKSSVETRAVIRVSLATVVVRL
jgi:hypothetical protein